MIAHVLASLLLGAGSSPASPLILYDAPPGRAYMEALTGGVLSREGDCVYLVNGSGRSLLILPSPRASWNPARGTIRFGGVELRFGEEAAFGGGEVGIGRGPQADAARRRGCDTRRVWWASPALVRRIPPSRPAPPPPPEDSKFPDG